MLYQQDQVCFTIMKHAFSLQRTRMHIMHTPSSLSDCCLCFNFTMIIAGLENIELCVFLVIGNISSPII